MLVYTFRTFPYKSALSKFCDNYFVFGKLKDDLKKFVRIVGQRRPDLIVGIAKSSKNYSRFERKAINQFNKTGVISKDGAPSYKLYYPSKGYKAIKLSDKPTDSFCNWTMYKIAEYINKSKTRLMFVHIKEKDIKKLLIYLSRIRKR